MSLFNITKTNGYNPLILSLHLGDISKPPQKNMNLALPTVFVHGIYKIHPLEKENHLTQTFHLLGNPAVNHGSDRHITDPSNALSYGESLKIT